MKKNENKTISLTIDEACYLTGLLFKEKLNMIDAINLENQLDESDESYKGKYTKEYWINHYTKSLNKSIELIKKIGFTKENE